MPSPFLLVSLTTHTHTHSHTLTHTLKQTEPEPLETITMSAFKPWHQRTIQGIEGIKTSYFPPQSPFIGATNPTLLNTGAASKKACILSELTNHFTVGIWFCNVEIEKDRGVYEHVCLLRWIFALIFWRLGSSPPICVHSASVGILVSSFSWRLATSSGWQRSTEGKLSTDSYQRRVLGFSKTMG